MNHREFQKRLKEVSAEHKESFGYPFISLRVIAEVLKLDEVELREHVQRELTDQKVVMSPISEQIQENLSAGLQGVTLVDVSGQTGVYVSLALKP
ncbi:MAG: hypothetical protein H7Y22_15770 [Gemmatimonadaceae bacterium]|nr:hypothetical protein [Gloeobacterales cyanobacterium ES-bin-141]